jgi:hypothetical protein
MGLKVKVLSKLKSALLSATAMLMVGVPLVLVPASTLAQTTTASLSGTVHDQSGAVVQKARVTLTNKTNGATLETITNKAGIFSFNAVQSGDYTVTITAKTFSTFSEEGVHLDPQDSRVLRNLVLTVGSATDVVSVEAEEGQLNVDGGEISSLISAEDIKHLAIEGRDVTELLKILPGFTPISQGIGNTTFDPAQVGVSGAVGQYSGNGSPLYAVALLSDGADITDPGNFGATIQTVNYDQVAEVKVQTASVSADAAHGPIIINALGAYGGTNFHGSLYTYARTYQLNSQDWYSKYTNQPKPQDRYLYPGFTFGGPVLIPGTKFNEARKLNFWVGAEDYAQRNVYAYGSAQAATATAIVPTAGMRTGDFSAGQIQQLLGVFYGPPTVKNGITTQGCSPNYAGSCEVPVTDINGYAVTNGNIANFLDPGAKALLNLYPQPNLGPPSLLVPYNWIAVNLNNNDLWQARGRIDYAPGEKTKVFLVYSTEKQATRTPNVTYYDPGGTNLPGGVADHIHTELGVLNVSTIITPTLTNEFYGSGSYFKENINNAGNQDQASTTGYPYQGLYLNGNTAVPQLVTYSAAAGGLPGMPLAFYQNFPQGGAFVTKWIRTAGDNVTKQLGKHTLRGGVFAQVDTNNQPGLLEQTGPATNGQISQYYLGESYSTGNQTVYSTGGRNTNYDAQSGNGGNLVADFAEGEVSAYQQQNLAPGANLYFWNIDGYAQDHWRILQHLTVDYGLRIEHITPWSDPHGVGVPVWNAAAYFTDQAGSPLPGFLWHDIDHNIPLSGYTTRWGYIEPRAGFSWDVLKKGNTILRGGFGIYRAHDSYNDASAGQSNAAGVRVLASSSPSYAGDANTTLSAISQAHAPITAGSLQGGSATTVLNGVQSGDDEMPQVKTWDFAVVQRLPKKLQLQMAYIGSYSNYMLDDGGNTGGAGAMDNINALPVGALYSTGQYHPSDYATVGVLATNAVNAFRPFPTYYDLDIARHRLYSNYNGLQSSLLKQSGHFLFNINYTFSKALGVLGGFNNGRAANPFNLRDEYLPESFDRTHVFNASYTYVEGNAFHFSSHLVNAFVNNWEVSGITNILSGQNLQSASANLGLNGTITGAPNPTVGNGSANFSLQVTPQAFLGTPDVVLEPAVTCNPSVSGNHTYINNACFHLPAGIGTQGTYRWPYLRGPGFFDSDLTLTRNIDLHHGQHLSIRIATFNFLNRANTSFNSNAPQQYQLSYNDVDPTLTNLADPATLASIPNANATGLYKGVFGHASLKSGRRVTEISIKYTF